MAQRSAFTSLFGAILILIPLAFAAASYVTPHVRERESGSKQMQVTSPSPSPSPSSSPSPNSNPSPNPSPSPSPSPSPNSNPSPSPNPKPKPEPEPKPEREPNQFVSGVPPALYWLGSWTWDVLIYLSLTALLMATFLLMQDDA